MEINWIHRNIGILICEKLIRVIYINEEKKIDRQNWVMIKLHFF